MLFRSGMGSLEAMEQKNGSKDRYFQGDTKDAKKLVPEGIVHDLYIDYSIECVV